VSLTRRYGRAPRGERITESVPKSYRQQRSIISSMGLDGAAAIFILEGAVDTAAFDIYVEYCARR
jgi:hypothetical protein